MNPIACKCDCTASLSFSLAIKGDLSLSPSLFPSLLSLSPSLLFSTFSLSLSFYSEVAQFGRQIFHVNIHVARPSTLLLLFLSFHMPFPFLSRLLLLMTLMMLCTLAFRTTQPTSAWNRRKLSLIKHQRGAKTREHQLALILLT